MKSEKLQRAGVIFIGLVFLLSMVAIALDSGDRTQTVELPQNIGTEPISEQMQANLVSQGAVIITLKMPESCDTACEKTKEIFEEITDKYSDFVFLVELEDSSGPEIIIRTAAGEESLDSFSESDIEDAICAAIPTNSIPYQKCIDRRAMQAALNTN